MSVNPGQIALIESSSWLYGSRLIFVTAVGGHNLYGVEIVGGDFTIKSYRFEDWEVVEASENTKHANLLCWQINQLKSLSPAQLVAANTLCQMLPDAQPELGVTQAARDQQFQVAGSDEGLLATLDIPAGTTTVELHRWIERTTRTVTTISMRRILHERKPAPSSR